MITLCITGAAGFIGFHLAKFRLENGDFVIGIDNLNDYYDVRLKEARLRQLQAFPNFIFYQEDISNTDRLHAIFKQYKPKRVVHLAAQAGVRYALNHPHSYLQSNLLGFGNVIEVCRHYEVEHLLYASSSSVYGDNNTGPSHESDSTDQPLSLYAATKKANELMAHAYSNLYQLPTTGLRFFTVYGPWGRPDMALFTFTKNILEGRPIQVHNFGEMQRDFTYIDDIVQGISLTLDRVAGSPSYKIYNIGYGRPIPLLHYIEAIEQALKIKAIKNLLPLQLGEVLSTHANTSSLEQELSYKPRMHYQEGIARFISWYRAFYS